MKKLALLVTLTAVCGSFARSEESGDAKFFGALKSARLESAAAVVVGQRGLASAYAKVGPDSSWGEIEEAYRPLFPMISFGSTFMSLNGVCVDGDNLRTRTPVKECVKSVSMGRRGQVCVETVEKFLYTPIVYQDQECIRRDHYSRSGGACRGYRTVTYRHDLSPMIGVGRRQLQHRGQSPFDTVFSKRYDVPVCR